MAVTILYDEDVDGDLSNDPDNPTVLQQALDAGVYAISGRALNSSDVLGDPDYWAISLGPDTYLSAIRVTEYDNSSYVDVGHGGFFGISEGLLVTATNDSVGNLLGGALVGVEVGTDIGADVLDNLQAPYGFGPFVIEGIGGELREGSYTFWFQEGNPTPDTPAFAGGPGPNSADDFVDYTFEFQVSQVPEPSTPLLMTVVMIAGLLGRRRNP